MQKYKYFDCRGEFPTLSAFLFYVECDDEYETIIGVNIGLTEIQLLISGRFRAKVFEILFNHSTLEYMK